MQKFNLTQYDSVKEDKPAPLPTHQEISLDPVTVSNAVAMEFYEVAKKHGFDNDKAYHAKFVKEE